MSFITINISAQCDQIETIVICDMTTIDNDSDGVSDGIINLYDAYTNQTGNSLEIGNWFDPGFNFSLNEMTGDVLLWDLDNSTEGSISPSDPIQYYEFELYNSSCGSSIPAITIKILLGPFEGNPLPASGPNASNVTICEAGIESFDLFQVFESLPSPHQNGVWEFIGNQGLPSNFISLSQQGFFNAQIPYEPGGSLIDFDVFEFSYTVPGVAPCSESKTVYFKVEVIRDVDSGIGGGDIICETDLVAGIHNVNIDLTDDLYLSGEDIEGTWSSNTDPTNQISNPGDSIINLGEVYDFLYQTNPRFGCESYTYSYDVETRATLANCQDKVSDVVFTFLEYVRPFSQNILNNEFCEQEDIPATINLYDYLEFTSENNVLYDYPNENGTNWSLVSGPSSLGLLSNTGQFSGGLNWNEAYVSGYGYTTPYRTEGTINLLEATPGTYVFRYSVLPTYNCLEIPDLCKNSVNNCQHPCSPETTDITIVIYPNNYAGENTSNLEFCKGIDIGDTIDLISLLEKDGVQGDVYEGSLGTWTNIDSGEVLNNPFVIPEITNSQTFNLIYNTNTNLPNPNGCPDEATLSFTVYEQKNSGIGGDKDLCKNNGVLNLFDLLTDDPNTNGSWTGPNNYNSSDNLGIIDASLAFSGDYIYTILANGTCPSVNTILSITIHDAPNAGFNQSSSPICSSVSTVNLLTLVDPLATSGGSFVDIDNTGVLSGSIVTVSNLAAGTYDYEYQVQGNPSCELEASIITITIQSPLDPGLTNTVTICENAAPIDLFNFLLGSPNNSGIWTGPEGFASSTNSAIINPLNGVSGNYIYTVPSNGICNSAQVTINLIINQVQNAGDNQIETVCKSDGMIDLFTLIDPMADIGGIFTDLNATGALLGSVLDTSLLPAGTYNFLYELVATSICSSATASLSVNILTVPPPIASNQTFCINEGATISSLLTSNVQEYYWYDTINSSEILADSLVLIDGEDYFGAVFDSNGCESDRVQITVTLLSLSNSNCDDGVGNGVSPNDDGNNDELDLGGLPILYPNFEIQIFNRYGTQVYKGNINTTPFKGHSNVSLSLGDELPSGVYFYVFNPNDGNTKPFQGDFYLSR